MFFTSLNSAVGPQSSGPFTMLRLVLLLRLVAADLVVPTSNGPVRGVFRDFAHQSASWWGIRYAEPPLGANRFKEPKVRWEQMGEQREQHGMAELERCEKVRKGENNSQVRE